MAEPAINERFQQRMFGHLWEGVSGWLPCLRACDHMADHLPPAAWADNIIDIDGNRWDPSDVLSTPELLAMQLIAVWPEVRPVWIGPSQLNALPDWEENPDIDALGSVKGICDTACRYGLSLKLPFEYTFLDFTDASGNPAWLPFQFRGADQPPGHFARACLYGAIVMRTPDPNARMVLGGATARTLKDMAAVGSYALFSSGSLVVIPFGSVLELTEGGETGLYPVGHTSMTEAQFRECDPRQRRRYMGQRDKDGKLLFFLPAAAPLGFMEFLPGGSNPVGHDSFPDRPTALLGDLGFSRARPTLGLIHCGPLFESDAGNVWAGVGGGVAVREALRTVNRLGVHHFSRTPREPLARDKHQAALGVDISIVAYQVEETLKALYLLESANVTLAPAIVSRQVRRAVERSQGKQQIALTVRIAINQRRRARPPAQNGHKREYAYSHDRRGHYHHVTRGPHAIADKMTPCPQWAKRHPHSERCRREWHPPTVIDAGEGKPYVPKTRDVRVEQYERESDG